MEMAKDQKGPPDDDQQLLDFATSGQKGDTKPVELPPIKDGGTPASPRRLRSSKADYMFGHMTTKVFQVREDQLDELGRANRDTTIASAICLGALAFAVDVTKDLLLAPEPSQATGFFTGVAAACWFVAVVSGVIAVLKWRERGALVAKIRAQTDFKGQDAE